MTEAKGFGVAVRAYYYSVITTRWTILAERGWLIMLVRALVTWIALSALPEVMRC